MRGDNPHDIRRANPANGSPPHARGQLRLADVYAGCQRFTPACAGTTEIIDLGVAS